MVIFFANICSLISCWRYLSLLEMKVLFQDGVIRSSSLQIALWLTDAFSNCLLSSAETMKAGYFRQLKGVCPQTDSYNGRQACSLIHMHTLCGGSYSNAKIVIKNISILWAASENMWRQGGFETYQIDIFW